MGWGGGGRNKAVNGIRRELSLLHLSCLVRHTCDTSLGLGLQRRCCPMTSLARGRTRERARKWGSRLPPTASGTWSCRRVWICSTMAWVPSPSYLWPWRSWWVCVSVCLSACLPVFLHVCLSACLPACLSACLLTCLPVSACLCACARACLPANACLSACLPACMHACLYICLPACLSACPSACLPACLSVCLLPAFLPICMYILPACLLDKGVCLPARLFVSQET